ncbi:MAG: Ig-like domain-containing protein [Pelobacteraceae bacterium]
MVKLLWSGVVMVMLLSGCGWDGTPTRKNDFIPLTSIEIVADSPTIAVSRTIAKNTSTTLSVKGNFSGLYTSDVTDQVVWTSDTPAVAGFAVASVPNRVSGLIPGSTTLTATVGNVTATFNLTVSDATITEMTITPVNPTITKGSNMQFVVNGTFVDPATSDTTTQDLTFDASWLSSATEVATVGVTAANKGLAHAVATGTATISATFDGVTRSSLLTVTEPVLQSIAVTPANPSVLTLSSEPFKATGTYSDGSAVDLTSQVAWSSSNAGIATIASSGTASTLTQGNSTINATLDGVSGSTILKVTGGNLTGIVPSVAAITLVKGTVARISATGTFSNSTTRDITGVVAWSAANTAVTVTAPGGNLAWLNASAVTPTSVPTIITAKYGTFTATTTVTVTAPTLQSIAISQTSLDLTAGTSSRLTATGTFKDNNGTITTQDVTASADWTSSAATTASVGNAGLAKGRVSGATAGSGSATITATYGGKSASTAVTVRTRIIQSLTMSGPASAAAGNMVSFTATASYIDGTSKDVTEDATWTIDTPNVALLADSQNQPGQIVAVAPGSATFSASFGGMSKNATVIIQ